MNETEKVATRLQQLRDEQEKGLRLLSELQTQERDLREKLLRINGAIQVLEELIETSAPTDPEPSPGQS